MAQPNLVREPSMDEILASIRRIIESNEPVTEERFAGVGETDAFAGQAANDDMEDVPLTVDGSFGTLNLTDDMLVTPEPAPMSMIEQMEYRAPQLVAANEAAPVQAFAPAPQPTAVAPAPQAASVESKSLSLADVAARVRAASERGVVREQPAPQPVMDAAMPVEPRVEEPVQSFASPIAVTALDVVEAEPQTMAEIAPATQPSTDVATTAVETTAPSLLSSLAGDKVARSFQDLQTALEEAERRSLDEIAEEMLRPMLQEWLDDNLPTLVERLVREEIERVARGPRR